MWLSWPLIWVESVCKGYHQKAKVATSKERVYAKMVHYSWKSVTNEIENNPEFGFHLGKQWLFIIVPIPAMCLMTCYKKWAWHTVKPVLSGHSKRRPKICFQYWLSLNAIQKYCRMLQREHSAILSNLINLPFSIKIFVLSISKWPLKTGFIVFSKWF